jgi:cytochrome P450
MNKTVAAQPKVPGPTPRELLPRLRQLQLDPLRFLHQFSKEYGGIARIPVPFMHVYNLAEPEVVKHILQDNAKNYTKQTLQYTNLALVAGQGLLTSDGAFWLRQRRMIQPGFHRNRIAGFGQEMTGAAEQLVQHWKARLGQEMDLDHEMMELTLQIVGKTLFSADLSQGASNLVRATLTALDFVMFRAQNPFSPDLFLPSQRRRSFKQALHTLDSAVHQLIAERRASGPKDDLLSMLLEARSDGGEAMSAVQLRDELITLIVAGHETVASSLTWTWYLIATHPQVEHTLHAELAAVLGGRTPTVEDLPLLPYTRAVVDESLRLYPPAWVITRRAIAADQIGPYTLPAGSLVITSPYVVHRQGLWSEPDSFKPERFLEEGKLPRYAYIPFGGGPRLCIGNNFALMESQLILATLAQHYRLRLVEGRPVVPQGLVTIRPKGGLWMRVEGRK